jgi:hypothetical protein
MLIVGLLGYTLLVVVLVRLGLRLNGSLGKLSRSVILGGLSSHQHSEMCEILALKENLVYYPYCDNTEFWIITTER